MALVLVACEANAETPTPAAAPTATIPSSYDVEYRVLTSRLQHDISLTYENDSGNTEQLVTTTEDRLWTYEFRAEPGQFVYVSVQNQEQSGTVACSVYVDGQIVESAESEGPFVIATCSGSAGG